VVVADLDGGGSEQFKDAIAVDARCQGDEHGEILAGRTGHRHLFTATARRTEDDGDGAALNDSGVIDH
jgi:hypothetical protein